MARTRYSWAKRAKELARKAKHEEKMKRRQSKSRTAPAEKMPDNQEEDG